MGAIRSPGGHPELPRSRGGSCDLALAETSFVVGVGGFGEIDVFATIPALQLFQVGLRLMVVRSAEAISSGR